MNYKPQLLIHQFSNSLILSAFSGVNLGNFYLSNQFNLCNLWLKNVQSKRVNYAKRTQFPKSQNVYNRNFNNELQRKTNNGLLAKTNPIKPNFGRRTAMPSIFASSYLQKRPCYLAGPMVFSFACLPYAGRTLTASGPFCPCADSYSTAWSS
jgi:hypothetical protein